MEEKIIKQFKELQKEKPALGDFPALATVIRETGATPEMVRRLHDHLISKDEYLRSEKDNNIFYLSHIAKKTL